jgi:hypothetical protein
MSETRSPGLRSPNVRKLLTKDLEGLPLEVANKDNTYMLAILASVWLDTDERLQARQLEGTHGRTV